MATNSYSLRLTFMFIALVLLSGGFNSELWAKWDLDICVPGLVGDALDNFRVLKASMLV